jgi:hypothetical protein
MPVTSATPGADATPTATAAVSAERTAAVERDGGGLPSFVLLVIAAGVVLLVLIFVTVLVALR